MDFFRTDCQEPPINEPLFGICDDEITGAYTVTVDPNTWIATVKNPTLREVVLTKIDGCVILKTEYKGRGRCDCMLTTADHLYLIELKDEDKAWKTHAQNQIQSTIKFITETHDLSRFKHKKGFSCNRRRPHFEVIENGENKKLFREYGFRLDTQAEVIIV